MATAVFEIEQGIPMPTNVHGRQKYPFRAMAVGDSLFVADKATGDAVRRAAHQWGAHCQRKFVSRSVEGGIRIWRVA